METSSARSPSLRENLSPFEHQALSILYDLVTLLRPRQEELSERPLAAVARSMPRYLCGEGDIEIDEAFRRVTRKGVEVRLSPKEYGLLVALARRHGAPVSRDELRREVWKGKNLEGSRTVSQHIIQLRRKLETSPQDPQYIRTTSGIGYELRCVPVSAGYLGASKNR